MDRNYLELFRPVFDTGAFIWFGGLLWLALAVDWKRFWSIRTVDVLAILLASILFELRQDDRVVTVLRHEVMWSFIAWTGIYCVCAYLGLRTLGQLLRGAARETASVGIGAAAWLLLAFTASTNFCSLTATPVGEEGQMAMRGGAYLRTTGKMPYGEVPGAGACGPLMYALHAELAGQAPAPEIGAESASAGPIGGGGPPLSKHDVAMARWIAGVAHGLLLLGMVVLGWQLHSASTGALLAALYGLLVPVVTHLATATVTVPAALVIWSLVAMAPRAGAWGAALGGLLLAAASGMNFYAVLLFPAWLAYCLRRKSALRAAAARAAEESGPVLASQASIARPGAHLRRDFGALTFVGAYVIVAAVGAWYVSSRTASLPPGTDFAYAVAGQERVTPAYTLLVDQGRYVLQPASASTQPSVAAAGYLGTRCLAWLAADGDAEAPPSLTAEELREIPKEVWSEANVSPPETVLFSTAEPVPFAQIRPANAEASQTLTVLYRQQAKDYSWWRDLVATARTLVESAWYEGAKPAGAWEQWKRQCAREAQSGATSQAAETDLAQRMRRIDELHGDVLTGHIGLALVLFVLLVLFGSRCTHWHLCALTAALMAGGQLWKVHDGGAYFAWYLPLAMLALFAGRPPAGRPAGRP